MRLIVLCLLLAGCAMTPKEAMLATEEELCTSFFQPLHPNNMSATVYGEILRRRAYCYEHATAYVHQRNIQMQQSMQMMGLGAGILQSAQPQVCTSQWNGIAWVQVCR
jgi:hypothetical protein